MAKKVLFGSSGGLLALQAGVVTKHALLSVERCALKAKSKALGCCVPHLAGPVTYVACSWRALRLSTALVVSRPTSRSIC